MKNSQRWSLAVAWAPFVIWAAVIFFLSSPSGSMEQTSRFIGPLVRFFFPDIAADTMLTIHKAVRKCAHFTEYFILAIFAVRAISKTFDARPRRSAVAAVLLIAAIASLDEINQSFEPMRTAAFTDVLIDIFGGICGAVFTVLASRISIGGKWR